MDSERAQFDEVFSLGYEELYRIARGIMKSHKNNELSATVVVNEAWLKLSSSPSLANTSPLHFRHIAARAMRQILVDASRRRSAQVRGAGSVPVTFDEALYDGCVMRTGPEMLALDEALTALSLIAPRPAALVEAKFFGGLSSNELAEVLQVSEATVMRDWRMAKAWLAREVRRALELSNI